MKVIIVGSGAGGATAARELAMKGFKVTVLEAGEHFKPFTRRLSWTKPLRRAGLLGSERTISRVFKHMATMRSSKDLVLVRGITTGGCTVVATGNMVRADRGLKEIGLNLSGEFNELEQLIGISSVPRSMWRLETKRMFKAAQKLGLNPKSTPKVVDSNSCASCGLCELGCSTGARWDARRFLDDAINHGCVLKINSPVQRVVHEKGRVRGVVVGSGRAAKTLKADLVILAAGGIGTAQILKASGLPAQDRLWADIVLTVGGKSKNAQMLKEPPMVWYAKKEDYIISPYIDILSHWFHKPWRNVSINDRVGIMIKLADTENGTVNKDGTVTKELTTNDRKRLDEAGAVVKDIMTTAGINGPFVDSMLNAGHFGGTVPLNKEDISSMHPSGLPAGLWVADLSLVPRSQGMPTILLTATIALRVARKVAEANDSSN